jgi:hypothetical protein
MPNHPQLRSRAAQYRPRPQKLRIVVAGKVVKHPLESSPDRFRMSMLVLKYGVLWRIKCLAYYHTV